MNDATILHEGLITTKEASKLFKYTSSYLSYLVRTNKINGHRIGRSWLIEKDSILHFAAQRGKQEKTIMHGPIYPRAPVDHAHHTLIEEVSSSPLDTIKHENVPDGLSFLSSRWIGATGVVMLLVSGTMTIQSPLFSQSISILQELPNASVRAHLALGEFVVAAAHAVIAADVAVAYGVAAFAPETAQVTVNILNNVAAAAPATAHGTVLVLIGVGDYLAETTALIPAQVAQVAQAFVLGAR